MSGGLVLRIDAGLDPAAEAGEAVPLIPAGGEYAVALERSLRLAELRSVPDEVFLTLYAYEVLERIRERLERRTEAREVWAVPLWPACAFRAADVAAHPADELAELYPSFDEVRYAVPAVETLERECRRVLGAVRLDPGRYLACALETARGEGWVVEP